MSANVVIPLSECARFSPDVVGSRSVKLAKYDALAIPLPLTIVIPVTTLQKLVQENNLADFFTKKQLHEQWSNPSSRHAVKQQLKRLIIDQPLPDWFTEPILLHYHKSFERGFVRLFPGDVVSTIDPTRFEHIQGDANLFESLKEFWAHWVEATLEIDHTFHYSALLPGTIVIQAQGQPLASGIAFTRHPDSGNKTQVLILAHKGAPDQELLASQADHFSVDVRTWNVVFRQVNAQTRMLQRTTDQLNTLPVPFADQLKPTLNDAECLELAQLVNQFKQHSFAHHTIQWEQDANGFVFTDFIPEQDAAKKQRAAQRTLTKLYISAGNPYKAPQSTMNIDGVGVLRSEYTYAQFGVHPAHIVHSRQREVLERALVACITQYQSAVTHQRVIFRSQNFNSKESLQLQYGNSYEPVEDNPYLGYRGGLKLISQPDLLRLELSVLQTALKNTAGTIGYMLSFVRTPQELGGLIHHIEGAGLFQNPQFELWMQLNTPENILGFLAYPTNKLTGVSLNVRTLQALLHGIDPDNPEVFERYSLDTTLLEQTMELLSEHRTHLNTLRETNIPLQLNIHLEDFSRDLVAAAVKLRYDGVVVKPRSVEIARGVIVEEEEKKLQHQ